MFPLTGRLGALAAAALLVLGACGTGGGRPAHDAAGHGGYPVSVTHRLGTTTIPARPERVVALGVGDIDAALALGVTPVGVAAAPVVKGGVWPWDSGRIGPASTTLLTGTGTRANLERIAALRPDLILAHGVADIDTAYRRLSEIAPTIADRHGVLGDSWQDVTRDAGRALHRERRAGARIRAVSGAIAATAQRYPRLRGRTFVVGWAHEAGSVQSTGTPSDVTARFLGVLGLRLSDKVPGAASGQKGLSRATIGYERLDVLDAGVLIVGFDDDAARRALERTALFRRLGAVREKRYVAVGTAAISALRVPTIGNATWILHQLTPAFEAVR